jgi:hypothetical protein
VSAPTYKELADAEWEAIESVLAAAHLVAGALPDEIVPFVRLLRATLAKYRKVKSALDAAHERDDERTDRDRKAGA